VEQRSRLRINPRGTGKILPYRMGKYLNKAKGLEGKDGQEEEDRAFSRDLSNNAGRNKKKRGRSQHRRIVGLRASLYLTRNLVWEGSVVGGKDGLASTGENPGGGEKKRHASKSN